MRYVVLLCGLSAVLALAPGSAPAAAPPARIAVSTADGRIALIDAAGRRRATLTKHTSAAVQDWDPAWSPDGRRIAFVRTTDAFRSFRIYTMRANGGGIRRITRGRFDESPAWSPDGRWIAYASAEGIRLVRPDGSGRRLVPGTGTTGPRFAMPFASNPAWTPGGRLAYSFHPEDPSDWPASCKRASNRCGWVLTARRDGRDRRPVVRGRDAHWSPDGRTVVFTPPNGGVATIVPSGGRARLLGRGYRASWSADGRMIVYVRLGDPPATDSVWAMRADGRSAHRIRRGATAPAWRPAR